MQEITLESKPIIECNIDQIKVLEHEQQKDNFMHIIQDLYASNVNYNNSHHSSVWQSPNGLQSIHSMNTFVNGLEIRAYSEILQNRYKLKSNKRLAIVDMWVTITPPGGQLIPKRRLKSLITGTYFLHTPAENATMNFKKPIDPHWYDKVFDPFNRSVHNSPEELISMNEGWIYFYPSYIESSTSTNNSKEERITIDFVLDVVDK